jgi:DNA-binding response OmpR family regulator
VTHTTSDTRPKGRVLFVDNDADARDLLDVVLRQAGYEPVIAATVADGLRLAKSRSFDLILLDLYFGDGAGIELCRAIRALDEQVPIFFYTGTGRATDVELGMKAGAQGFFIKPVDIDDLVGTISRYVSSAEPVARTAIRSAAE